MPLRFILALDSFKESMTAEQACSAMQRGITRIFPDAHCIHVPMADGGEGTVDTFIAASNGQAVQSKVTGPLASQHIRAYFALIDQGKTKSAQAKNRRVEIEITVDESKVPKNAQK